MRALPLFAFALLACQSGVSLDPAAPYRCTATPSTAGTQSDCPEGLFCGFDATCHATDVGGTYPCAADSHCGGGFRCGPAGTCVDPSADALRTDAPETMLTLARQVPRTYPWASGIG